MELPRYVILEKKVGETPLACMEAWRAKNGVSVDVPLTYAGRLDPMASGKLLILIGEECKKKEIYLNLDKVYEFSVLFGIGSDTHDVLGRLTSTPYKSPINLEEQLEKICKKLNGEIELPYPHFSSKTVQGKPLFEWSLEGKLREIEIPTRKSTIYSLALDRIETKSRAEVAAAARIKIDTIPEITNPRKDLGENFRRTDVRSDWGDIEAGLPLPRKDLGRGEELLPEQYQLAYFTCRASSGTYMRTLAKLIGSQLNPPTPSLAWSIHRSTIMQNDLGDFTPTKSSFG